MSANTSTGQRPGTTSFLDVDVDSELVLYNHSLEESVTYMDRESPFNLDNSAPEGMYSHVTPKPLDNGWHVNLKLCNLTTHGCHVDSGFLTPVEVSVAHGYQYLHARSIYHKAIILVICMALLGNSLLVVTIARHRQLRTITNAFIVSLALADLMFAFPTLPLHMLAEEATGPLLGQPLDNMCVLIMSLTSFQVIITLVSLFALTVERYICFLYPLKHRKWAQRRYVGAAIAVMWIYSLLIGVLPVMGWNSLLYYNPWAQNAENGTTTVATLEPQCAFVTIHTGPYIGFLALIHIFPICIVMPIFYIRIFMTIRQFLARKSCHSSVYRSSLLINDDTRSHHSADSQHSMRLSGRRSLRLLIVIAIYGVFSWTPILLWYACATHGFTKLYVTMESLKESPLSMTYYQVTAILGLGNSAINPYLYGLGNIPIRHAFLNMFRRGRCFGWRCRPKRQLDLLELNSRTLYDPSISPSPPRHIGAHTWNGLSYYRSQHVRSFSV